MTRGPPHPMPGGPPHGPWWSGKLFFAGNNPRTVPAPTATSRPTRGCCPFAVIGPEAEKSRPPGILGPLQPRPIPPPARPPGECG